MSGQTYGFGTSDKERQILQTLGGPSPDAKYQTTIAIVRDTLLFGGGATIQANNELYTTANKSYLYKTAGFPSNSQAFSIDAINVMPYLKFAVTGATDDAAARNKLLMFLQLSFLTLYIENNEVFKLPLNMLTPYFGINEPGAATANAWTKIDRRNADQGFKLPSPVIINAGQTFQFSIVTSGTWVTDTVQAGNYLDLPDSGLANNKGYALFVDLITRNVRQRY